jgi:predicted transcriptional regulator
MVLGNREALAQPVSKFMSPPLGTIDDGERFGALYERLSGADDAILVTHDKRPVGLVTRADLLSSWVNARHWAYEI